MNPHRRCAWCDRITSQWIVDDDGDIACANECEMEATVAADIEVSTPVIERPKLNRGFRAMPKEKQLALASKGGKASHAAGTGHTWTKEEARIAGARGGLASRGGRGKLATSEPGK